MSTYLATHRNLARAHGFEALEIEGELPEDLVGTLHRVGPALFERFGVRVPHPFEADGAITAVRFDGRGGARGATRIIGSRGYREEQAAGRLLYGSTTGRLRRVRNNLEHLVFAVCPAKLEIWRALLGEADFTKLFAWQPREGSELIVVPLAAPVRPVRIPCDSFWVWHFANGFARGTDELVFDMCRYADFSSLDAIGGAEPGAPPLYHRVVVELGARRMRSEAMFEGACEFPRVHPAVEGREHEHVWLRQALDGDDAPEGIAHVELDGATIDVWRPQAEIGVSEPVPVARPGRSGEREVWILVLCHDSARERSFVAVLDGRDLAAGPVARVCFDQTIPLTFHGSWAAA